MLITKNNLLALGVTNANADKFLQPLNDTIAKYGINTPLRLTHFLAQVLTESIKLSAVLEEASGKEYEGRKDLGNVQAGDGVKFKGRGLIQLTGRGIYKDYGNYKAVDLINHPELLETPEYAADSAGWFWAVSKKDIHGNSLNIMADADDFLRITYFVNGGFNGIRDRYINLRKGYTLFGITNPEDHLKMIADRFRIAFIAPPQSLTGMQRAMLRTIPNEGILQKLIA